MGQYIFVTPETLGGAVGLANSGDTIVLDEGEYKLMNTIVIPDGIKLTSVYGVRRGRMDEK